MRTLIKKLLHIVKYRTEMLTGLVIEKMALKMNTAETKLMSNSLDALFFNVNNVR